MLADSLRDSKSSQVSRTLLCILSDLNNAVVWKVSTHQLTSKSSCPWINVLVTVPKASITIGIIIPQFYQFPDKVPEIIFLLAFLQSYFVVSVHGKVYNSASPLFMLTITTSGRLAVTRWSVYYLKNPRGVCASYSPGQIICWAYIILFVLSNLNL